MQIFLDMMLHVCNLSIWKKEVEVFDVIFSYIELLDYSGT